MDISEFSIPDKLYFRIGEVAKLIGVEPYVLRYWQTEFSEIAPTKSRSQQRIYRRQDVELICLIRDLLYKSHFTIKGAKQKLKDKMAGREVAKAQLAAEHVPVQLPLGVAGGALTEPAREAIKAVIEEMQEFLDTPQKM